jgi:hypothetical protein
MNFGRYMYVTSHSFKTDISFDSPLVAIAFRRRGPKSSSTADGTIQRDLSNEENNNSNKSNDGVRDSHLISHISQQPTLFMQTEPRTLVSSFHIPGLAKCSVADHTCKNNPTIMHSVALVKNIMGICQVMICSKLGARRPVFTE